MSLSSLSSLSSLRQTEIADVARSAEHVYQTMLTRLRTHTGPMITMSADEYTAIGLHIATLCGVAKEYAAALAGGTFSRDQLIAMAGHIAVLCQVGTALAAQLQPVLGAALTDPTRIVANVPATEGREQ